MADPNYQSISALVKRIGQGDKRALGSLDPESRRLIENVLRELHLYGYSRILDSLWEEDFEIKPATIEQFIEDDYYLGEIGKDLFPRWKKELAKVCDPRNEINEWVIRGSIGSGKTFCAVFALLYRIHYLCCMKNPQHYYKMANHTPIVFGFFNIFKYLAQDTSYKYFTNWIKISPFFQDIMRKAYHDEKQIPGWLSKLNKTYGISNEDLAQSYVKFPKGITIALGSNAIHALGQNLFGGLCLAGDVEIPLLDGSVKKISDLYEEYRGKEFWVYSKDLGSNRVVAGKAKNIRLTRVNHPVVKVTLSNGESFRVTPDHLCFLQGGTKVEASDLKVGDKLSSIERRLDKDGYEKVYTDNDIYSNKATHRAVYESINNCLLEDGKVVHHLDHDKRNNDPTNLIAVSRKQHNHDHTSANWKNQPEKMYYGVTQSNGLSEYNKEKRLGISYSDIVEATRVASSEVGSGILSKNKVASKLGCARSVIDRRLKEAGVSWRELASQFGRTRDDDRNRPVGAVKRFIPEYDYGFTLADVESVVEGNPSIVAEDVAALLGVDRPKLCRALIRFGSSWADIKLSQCSGIDEEAKDRPWFAPAPGSSVVSVEYDGCCDTYCFTVETYGNFLIKAGVVVSNCDEADMSKSRSLTSEDKTKVEELYIQAKSRIVSRFQQIGGVNPGLLILVSQVQDADSFLSKHQAKTEGDLKVHHTSFAIWEIKEDRFPPDEPKFKVAVGNRRIRSYIVDVDEEGNPVKPIPQELQVIHVPESLRTLFEYSLDDAIRDQAGIPTYGVNLFLPRRDKLYDIYGKCSREHPFTSEEVILSIEADDDTTLVASFDKTKCMININKATGSWKPKWYAGVDRAIHVDLSKSKDCTGIAMGCLGNVARVERYDNDGRPYSEIDVTVFIDFAVRVRAAKGSEIDYSKIRALIYYLHRIGYMVRWASFDSYQSTDSLQQLKKAGYDVKDLSVDKKPAPYYTLRNTIYEGRLDIYEYEPFTEEITKLQDNSHVRGASPAIDHPQKGSKDVTDAVCGVVTRLMQEKELFDTSATPSELDRKLAMYQRKSNSSDGLHDGKWVGKQQKAVNPLEKLFKR